MANKSRIWQSKVLWKTTFELSDKAYRLPSDTVTELNKNPAKTPNT